MQTSVSVDAAGGSGRQEVDFHRVIAIHADFSYARLHPHPVCSISVSLWLLQPLLCGLVLGSLPVEQHGYKHSAPHKAATGPSSHSKQCSCPVIHELRVLTEILPQGLQSPEDGQASEILIMTKPHRHFLRCRKLTSAMLETGGWQRFMGWWGVVRVEVGEVTLSRPHVALPLLAEI